MHIDQIVARLKKEVRHYPPPLSDQIVAEYGRDPYLILISCLLSLRAKDVMTIHTCRALFKLVRTPQQMVALPRHALEKIVFTTGFYKTKARVLQTVSQTLLDQFDGKVPDNVDALMGIKGIGPKTAQLVLGVAFGKPAVCVDTHVHRISNRLGLVKTVTVEQTEAALRKLLPKKYWIIWNNLLVVWGQQICVPVSPKCSQCAIRQWCKRVGVMRSR
jgi:endonuclease-3